MTRLLIVGGGGFIGRSLLKRLASEGHREVLVTGRSAKPAHPLFSGVEYRQVMPDDLQIYANLLEWADEVIDLAYSTVPQTSFDNPVRDVIDNLPFSVALIKLASETSLRKFLFVSSGGTVYGHPVSLPINETHPTNPVSPYGITKLAIEKYGLLYRHSKALNFVAVRPGNPYGPGQIGGRGQGFVATAMLQAIKGEEVTIFGNRGTIRDYLHIDDLSSGLISALNFAPSGSILNIGTGVGRDNKDILNLIETFATRDQLRVKISVKPSRQFDVSANVLDASRLRELSGWQPTVDIAQGLEETWAWIKENSE